MSGSTLRSANPTNDEIGAILIDCPYMKINLIHIENFRSIQSLEFSPGDYSVLIGENNSGKSNILRALQLVIGEAWPTERLFSENDFYSLDTSRQVVIRVLFDATIEHWVNKHLCEVQGFQLTCKAYKRKSGKKNPGDLKCDYCCVGKKGDLLSYPAEPLRKGEKYTGQWIPLRVNSDMRDTIPLIYVDVMREYDRYSPGGRWTILRKLFDDVNREFQQSTELIEVPSVEKDRPPEKARRMEVFERRMQSAYELLKTESFKRIEEPVAKNAMEHMGISKDEGAIELHFDSHDPAHVYKSLQLFVNQLGIQTSASDVGAGLQSAIVVAILRTYEELKKDGAIFAIEEPEVFLHPQKARYFASVLKSIASTGNQVFVSTHSPIFVNIENTEDVCLVRRSKESGTTVKKATPLGFSLQEREILRLVTEFDAQRNELFFARKVLITEGDTEKIIFPFAFKAVGVDMNRLGISVIEAGGKTKIPLFTKVCQAMDLPFHLVVDTDIHPVDKQWPEKKQAAQKEENSKHERWNKDIAATVNDKSRITWFSPDIEAVCGLPRNSSTKIDRAYEMFAHIKEEEIPEEIRIVIEAVLRL